MIRRCTLEGEYIPFLPCGKRITNDSGDKLYWLEGKEKELVVPVMYLKMFRFHNPTLTEFVQSFNWYQTQSNRTNLTNFNEILTQYVSFKISLNPTEL